MSSTCRTLAQIAIFGGYALALSACEGIVGDTRTDPRPPDSSDGGVTTDSAVGCVGSACAASCTGDECLGPSSPSRLVRSEYQRTISRLLSSELGDAREFLPADGYAGSGTLPFASNEQAVGSPEVLRYRDAAEALAERMVPHLGDLGCTDVSCVGDLIADLGLRLYRHPLSTEDAAALRALFDMFVSDGFSEGMRAVLEAMLQSPQFLYHWEIGTATDDEAVVALTSFELATRLASFLWVSSPDQELLHAAASGALDTQAGVEAQVDRMLAHRDLVESVAFFHRQWMGVDSLVERQTTLSTDEEYSSLTPQLARDMASEVGRMSSLAILERGGTMSELMSARYSTITPLLADFYGLARPAGSSWSPVEYPADFPRAGIVGLAGTLLANDAEPGSDGFVRPIWRGRFIVRNLFCTELHPPDDLADQIAAALQAERMAGAAGRTDRERLESMTQADGTPCAGCHATINPPGFGLMNFDRMGRFHTEQEVQLEGGGTAMRPIDSSGSIGSLEFEGAAELADVLATDERVSDCYVRQWYRYALRRADHPLDRQRLTALSSTFGEDDHVLALLRTIATDPSFRRRRLPVE